MATVYFRNAVNEFLNTAGNWFDDFAGTTPHGSNPISTDDVLGGNLGLGNNIDGGIVNCKTASFNGWDVMSGNITATDSITMTSCNISGLAHLSPVITLNTVSVTGATFAVSGGGGIVYLQGTNTIDAGGFSENVDAQGSITIINGGTFYEDLIISGVDGNNRSFIYGGDFYGSTTIGAFTYLGSDSLPDFFGRVRFFNGSNGNWHYGEGELPAVSNVRDGTIYGVGTFTGTVVLPAEADVRDGVIYDTGFSTGTGGGGTITITVQ